MFNHYVISVVNVKKQKIWCFMFFEKLLENIYQAQAEIIG